MMAVGRSEKRRTVLLAIRVLPADRDEIKAEAARLKISMAELVRRRVLWRYAVRKGGGGR